jgi:hypothetical protein
MAHADASHRPGPPEPPDPADCWWDPEVHECVRRAIVVEMKRNAIRPTNAMFCAIAWHDPGWMPLLSSNEVVPDPADLVWRLARRLVVQDTLHCGARFREPVLPKATRTPSFPRTRRSPPGTAVARVATVVNGRSWSGIA